MNTSAVARAVFRSRSARARSSISFRSRTAVCVFSHSRRSSDTLAASSSAVSTARTRWLRRPSMSDPNVASTGPDSSWSTSSCVYPPWRFPSPSTPTIRSPNRTGIPTNDDRCGCPRGIWPRDDRDPAWLMGSLDTMGSPVVSTSPINESRRVNRNVDPRWRLTNSVSSAVLLGAMKNARVRRSAVCEKGVYGGE